MSIFHRIKKGHYITSDSIAIDKERTLKDFANLKNVNAVSDTNYPNENSKIATMNFLSLWNGAYNSNKNSNLQYCKNGEILGSQSNAFIYRGIETSNINNCTQTGFYYTNTGNPINGPHTDMRWSPILVFNVGSLILQITIPLFNQKTFSYRFYSGSPSSWEPWRTISAT